MALLRLYSMPIMVCPNSVPFNARVVPDSGCSTITLITGSSGFSSSLPSFWTFSEAFAAVRRDHTVGTRRKSARMSSPRVACGSNFAPSQPGMFWYSFWVCHLSVSVKAKRAVDLARQKWPSVTICSAVLRSFRHTAGEISQKFAELPRFFFDFIQFLRLKVPAFDFIHLICQQRFPVFGISWQKI